MGNLRQSMTTEEWDEIGKRLSAEGGGVSYYGGAIPDDSPIDNINHPPHYGGENNPYEVIKIIDAQGWGVEFSLGNALKYIMRAGKKTEDAREDLEKAMWYIQHAIKSIK
jgi:hypothetical protein